MMENFDCGLSHWPSSLLCAVADLPGGQLTQLPESDNNSNHCQNGQKVEGGQYQILKKKEFKETAWSFWNERKELEDGRKKN